MSRVRDKHPGLDRRGVACYRLRFPAWGSSPRCDTVSVTEHKCQVECESSRHSMADQSMM